jgi:hypothetical protein
MSDLIPTTIVEQAVLNKSRKDKFIMIFNIPKVMKTIISKDVRRDRFANLDSVQFSLYNCPAPAIKSDSIDVPYAGQVYNTSSYSRPKYEPITINFAVDNEYNNYWLFWKWLSILNHPRDSLYGGPKATGLKDPKEKYDFVTDIHVIGMDEYNNHKIRFDFFSCLITSLGKIEYNVRDPEEIDCTCEMVFNQLDVTLLDVER